MKDRVRSSASRSSEVAWGVFGRFDVRVTDQKSREKALCEQKLKLVS